MAEVIAGSYRHGSTHWAKWLSAGDPRYDQGGCNLAILCRGEDYRPVEGTSFWSFYHSGLLPSGPICPKCERLRIKQGLDGPTYIGANNYRLTYEEQLAHQRQAKGGN